MGLPSSSARTLTPLIISNGTMSKTTKLPLKSVYNTKLPTKIVSSKISTKTTSKTLKVSLALPLSQKLTTRKISVSDYSIKSTTFFNKMQLVTVSTFATSNIEIRAMAEDISESIKQVTIFQDNNIIMRNISGKSTKYE